MIIVPVVIMRNEYATYRGLIDTLIGCDYAVFVHCGSERAFYEMFERARKTMPYPNHVVTFMDWYDGVGFDQMRNFADQHALYFCQSLKMDISDVMFLSIDCDERLPLDWDHVIRDAGPADSYRTLMQNGDNPLYRQRKLYRYGSGRWHYPVHEIYALKPNATSIDIDLTLRHLYDANPDRDYLPLLQDYLSVYRDDPRYMYYYFRERFYRNTESPELMGEIHHYLRNAPENMDTDMLSMLLLQMPGIHVGHLITCMRHLQSRHCYYMFANAANNAGEYALSFYAATQLVQRTHLPDALIPIPMVPYQVNWIVGSACYGIGWLEKAAFYFGLAFFEAESLNSNDADTLRGYLQRVNQEIQA